MDLEISMNFETNILYGFKLCINREFLDIAYQCIQQTLKDNL